MNELIVSSPHRCFSSPRESASAALMKSCCAHEVSARRMLIQKGKIFLENIFNMPDLMVLVVEEKCVVA